MRTMIDAKTLRLLLFSCARSRAGLYPVGPWFDGNPETKW
ncbi:MAG: hypothetical protein CM1200mP20_06750 [Pseudomonadota bacterium]|nr:MAG: hypothetical protein CM1200mP20_06750 [Pseudomonadota bacterium]